MSLDGRVLGGVKLLAIAVTFDQEKYFLLIKTIIKKQINLLKLLLTAFNIKKGWPNLNGIFLL